MVTNGRARFSKVPLIVAPLISCSSFGLVSKAIGITHAIMVLLCVAYAIPNQHMGHTQSDSFIYAIGGKIHCDEHCRIYDLYGRDMTHQNGSLPKGVYVVQRENSGEKVRVF